MKFSNGPPCSKCQEMYCLLNYHFMTHHVSAKPNNEVVLGNILINILSLLINPNGEVDSEERSKSAQSHPVISRPDGKSLLGENTKKQYKPSKQLEEVVTTSESPIFSSFLVNSTSELTPKLAFQPDALTNLITANLTQPAAILQTNEKEKLTTDQTSKQMNTLDFSNLMIPTSNDFVSATAAFITPEGNLTPAGISLILSNQNKATNSSGKSDLDVADILVNKMPIPSLNKALDPNFLQLSTLYLQQLALNQQAHTLAPSTSIPAQNNTIKQRHTHALLQYSSKQTKQKQVSVQEDQITEQLSACLNDNPSSNGTALQQLIVRHKQIAELIDALNNKKNVSNEEIRKTFPIQPVVQASPYQTTTNFNFNQMGILSSPVLTLPHLMTADTSGASTDDTTTISTSTVPVSIFTMPSSIIEPRKPEDCPTTDRLVIEDSVCETERDKIPGFFSSPSDNSQLSFVNNKINDTSTSKKTTNPKTALFSLQNLVIEAAGTNNLENMSMKEDIGQYELGRKCKYSAVTMVPIAQYDPLNITATTPSTEHDGALSADVDESSLTQDTKVLYKCDVCSVTFTVLSTLQAHMRSHLTGTEQECNYCKMTFADSEEYYKHVSSHRGEENIFSCQYCSKIFTSKGDFNKHIIKHTQRRPYICSHCQKSFRDPGSLTKHERIHTGEQPYVCETCNRGFAEKSSLRKHMRVHSGEKPYKCDQCNKSFSISGNLRRHLFIHTGQRPFKCTLCTKAFNNPSHLRRHIKNIHRKDREVVKENTTCADVETPVNFTHMNAI